MSERPTGFNTDVNFSRAIHLMHQIRRGEDTHNAEMLKAYDIVKSGEIAKLNMDPRVKYAFTTEAIFYGLGESLADLNVAARIFWRAARNEIQYEVEQFKIKTTELQGKNSN